MWKWGGGWLSGKGLWVLETFQAPFHDFAGSLVVHACGGFAGLAAAIVLGPRLGRFTADGKSRPMPGHNLAMATLGVFILWVGWYGFNPGSQLVFSDHANADATMLIATNTTLAAAAGGVAAMLLAWCLFKKPDLSMALNGVLGGLVGITANCDQVTNLSAMAIGLIAGLLVVCGVMLLDKLKIDDPVGAWPVHGLCGVWGGLATAVFGTNAALSWGSQLAGSIAIPVWAFVTMFILFSILKAVGILRVSPEDESRGLDITEHGMHAYEV
jgi:Amt family ammonium transporter